MWDLSKLSGFINVLANWFMRLSVTNIYWFLINLPVSFIFFNIYFVPIEIGALYYIVAFFICIPLLFFPSTVAMFATTRDWVLNRPQVSLTKAFFSYFRDNYRKSCLSGLIFTIVWIIWYGDYYYANNIGNSILSIVFLMIGFFLIIFTIHFLILIVHLELDIKALFKNAFFITAGKPIASLLLLIIALLVGYISFTKLLFLVVFFTGSIIAYLSFLISYQLYLKTDSENE